MRVHYKREGGVAYFPGLSKPVTLDTEQMPAEDAAELKRLVDEAGFFDLPVEPQQAPPGGAADYYRYTIAVETGQKRHTVQVTDPVEDPGMKKLLDFIRDKTRPSG